MDPFFLAEAASDPKNVAAKGKHKRRPEARPRRRADDDEIDEETLDGPQGARERRERPAMEFGMGTLADDEAGEEEDVVTPAEKRARMAAQYIRRMRMELKSARPLDAALPGAEDEAESSSDDDGTEATIARTLRREAAVARQREKHRYGQALQSALTAGRYSVERYGGHALSVTCTACASSDAPTFYSGAKDGRLIAHDVETKTRTVIGGHRTRPKGASFAATGHIGPILAMTLSADGRLLATGGADSEIRIWDVRMGSTATPVHRLQGHRRAVLGLRFDPTGGKRAKSAQLGVAGLGEAQAASTVRHQLVSASEDRLVKVWSAEEGAFVESLFGHTDPVRSVDAWSSASAVSGGADGTVRYWKIAEQKQLLFARGHIGAVECVAALGEDAFISGGEDGALVSWHISKRRPLTVTPQAHAVPEPARLPRPARSLAAAPWISALAALRSSDLLASGSLDGHIRFWALPPPSAAQRSLLPLGSVDAPGVVNHLLFPPASAGSVVLMAALGQEPKLGRWLRFPDARNTVLRIRLNNLL